VECKTRLEGGCDVECKKPEGALFCDGQFVDDNGNLDACIAAIEAAVDIQVDATGTADGDCTGNQCQGTAEGSVSSSCALLPATSRRGAGAAPSVFALLAAVGLIGARRRR